MDPNRSARDLDRPEGVAAWRFVPAGGRSEGPPEEAAFRSRIAGALRAGQGLGVVVGLAVASGPDPRISLWAGTAGTARWVNRVVGPAYLPNQWVPEPPPTGVNGPPGFSLNARRRFAWPEPLVSPVGPASLLDASVTALSALPVGASLRWEWRAVPEGRLRFWDVRPPPLVPLPSPSRLSASHRPERRPEPPALPVSRPLFGRMRVTLDFVEGSPASRVAPRVRDAVEAVVSSDRGNRLVFHRPWARLVTSSPRRGPGLLLSTEEWEGFWPRPWSPATGDVDGRGPDCWLLPLGRTATGAAVGQTVEPAQGRHLAVLGETGMGKSSLLVAVALRAFRRSGGVVFDPLGETVRALRDQLPPSVLGRSVWVAPEPGTVGVNALEGIAASPDGDPIRSERRLNDLVHALRRVRSGRYEESSYWGPRLEEMVTRAVRAASALPRGTLVDAHTLLATGGRLGRPVPPAAVDPIRELADRIRERPEDGDGARRLLHEVVRSPVLVRMLCEPEPARSTRDLVAPGRVVLISGDAAVVGEATSRYLLSVYLALVWSELLARDGSPKTFVVLDEAQWFSHESLGEMLRLGRRRNVHVVLATQAVASLAPSVGEAVWTNVSDFVAFRGSPEEAREFSRASRVVSAEELLALPRGSAAALLGKGHVVRWVRTIRRPGPGRPAEVGSPAPGASGTPPFPGPGEMPAPAAVGSSGGEAPIGVDSGTDRLADVLSALVRRADGLAPGEPLVVGLESLRREVDPAGDGVRRAGSLLGRLGVLERQGSSERGARWTIRPDGFAGLRAAASSAVSDRSVTPQPS
jgi:DNA helicase HerA-like ATPase